MSYRQGCWVVLGVGFLLRVWGIDFGLPHEYCRPDETTIMYRALSVGSGDLNPQFFNYPSLHFYVVALAIGLTYLTGLGLGYFGDLTDLQRLVFADPTLFYLVGRLVTAILGTCTIALVYAVASRLESRRAGLVSAVFVAVAYLHVRDSHFLTVDVPATFWILAAFCLVCRHIDGESLATGVLAGVCIGFAASTKYNAALFAPAIMLAPLVTGRGQNPKADSPLERLLEAFVAKWRHLTAIGVAVVASFVIGSPFVLVEPQAFIEDLSFERTMFAAGRGLDLGVGWIYHLQVSLWSGLGWPLLLAGLAGCGLLAVRRRPADLLVISGIIIYYSVAGSGKSVFVRYMIPLVPLLCITAAVAVVRATHHLRGRWWLPLVTALIATPALSSSLQYDRILARRDTRLMAATWIEENVPSGTRIALVGSEYGYPRLGRTQTWKRSRLADLKRAGERAGRLETELRLDNPPPGPVYETVELRAGNPQRLRSVWSDYSVEALVDSGVSWVVTQDHPLPFSSVPQDFGNDLQRLARPVQTFDPFSPGEAVPGYDLIDAFYVPLTEFSAVERPGPILRILHLDSRDSPPGNEESG